MEETYPVHTSKETLRRLIQTTIREFDETVDLCGAQSIRAQVFDSEYSPELLRDRAILVQAKRTQLGVLLEKVAAAVYDHVPELAEEFQSICDGTDVVLGDRLEFIARDRARRDFEELHVINWATPEGAAFNANVLIEFRKLSPRDRETLRRAYIPREDETHPGVCSCDAPVAFDYSSRGACGLVWCMRCCATFSEQESVRRGAPKKSIDRTLSFQEKVRVIRGDDEKPVFRQQVTGSFVEQTPSEATYTTYYGKESDKTTIVRIPVDGALHTIELNAWYVRTAPSKDGICQNTLYRLYSVADNIAWFMDSNRSGRHAVSYNELLTGYGKLTTIS